MNVAADSSNVIATSASPSTMRPLNVVGHQPAQERSQVTVQSPWGSLGAVTTRGNRGWGDASCRSDDDPPRQASPKRTRSHMAALPKEECRTLYFGVELTSEF